MTANSPDRRLAVRTLLCSISWLATLCLAACASTGEPGPPTPNTEDDAGLRVVATETGRASYYNVRTNGGHHTASGEQLCDRSMTAAHRTLPMGSKVRVTNERNQRSVIVRINNRGPFIKGRVIDLTEGAARELKMIKAGVVPVRVEILTDDDPPEEEAGETTRRG